MECCGDFGILRSSGFRYKGHIDQICLKANRLSGMIAKLSQLKRILWLSCLQLILDIKLNVHRLCETRSKLASALSWKEYSTVIHADLHIAPAYDDRLQILGLPLLHARRETTDLTVAFKVFTVY